MSSKKQRLELRMTCSGLHPWIACSVYFCSFCRYCFLEFQSSREAEEAVATTNGYKLDKQHTFAVNPFSDFDK